MHEMMAAEEEHFTDKTFENGVANFHQFNVSQ